MKALEATLITLLGMIISSFVPTYSIKIPFSIIKSGSWGAGCDVVWLGIVLGKVGGTLTVGLRRVNIPPITVIESTIAATAAAFVLSKVDLKFKKTIFLIIQLSLLFNAYTLSIPRYLIYNGMGIIDTYWVYILPAIPSSMGVFLMKQYMDGYIPDALIEAAKIDGANYLRIFWSVIFPNVKPCVLTLVLFAFQSIWATIPTGTIFNESLKTLPTVMSTIGAGGIARSGASMAATVIMMIPPIVVYLFSQSSIKETMGSAGIKG
jgi:ABC-type glycerol-3-phosphate transport system permease component